MNDGLPITSNPRNHSSFELRHSFVIRHSSFVIRHFRHFVILIMPVDSNNDRS